MSSAIFVIEDLPEDVDIDNHPKKQSLEMVDADNGDADKVSFVKNLNAEYDDKNYDHHDGKHGDSTTEMSIYSHLENQSIYERPQSSKSINSDNSHKEADVDGDDYIDTSVNDYGGHHDYEKSYHKSDSYSYENAANYAVMSPVTSLTDEQDQRFKEEYEAFKKSKKEKDERPVCCIKIFCFKGCCGKKKTNEEEEEDPNIEIKAAIRELAAYIVFLLLITIITNAMNSTIMYYNNRVMKDLFVGGPGFDSFTTQKDFYKYLENDFLHNLHMENYYNEEPIENSKRGYIFGENKVLGRARLRQIRVRNDSCIVHDDFKREIKECFAPYSDDALAMKPFGAFYHLDNTSITWKAWNYTESTDDSDVVGAMETYKPGGYILNLGGNKSESDAIVKELKKYLWLNRGSRAVMIDFAVYNANVNLFNIITLFFEFPATGGCIPYYHFRTLKLIRYLTKMDWFVLGCEALWALFLLFYTIEECIEVKRNKIVYFTTFWNVVDFSIIFIGWFCVAVNGYRAWKVGHILKVLVNESPDMFPNFGTLVYYQMVFENLIAFGVFLCWIKLFKYLSFNKTMLQLQYTLSNCARDIVGFAVMFFIVFLAYAQWGYLIFGTQVKDFSTYEDAVYCLFRIILGDFDFVAIEAANRVLGPIYFITYVFFVFFVLINMFLAIINDTYAEVKEMLENKEDELNMATYFKQAYQNLVAKLNQKKQRLQGLQKALREGDANGDGLMEFDEWRTELKNKGHADNEIEAVFAKYDMDGDRVLNEHEILCMYEDLEKQKNEIEEEEEEAEQAIEELEMKEKEEEHGDEDIGDDGSDGSSIYNPLEEKELDFDQEYPRVEKRIKTIEQQLALLTDKLSMIMNKMEFMESDKQRRRITLTKILETFGEKPETSVKVNMKGMLKNEFDKWKHAESDFIKKQGEEKKMLECTEKKLKKRKITMG